MELTECLQRTIYFPPRRNVYHPSCSLRMNLAHYNILSSIGNVTKSRFVPWTVYSIWLRVSTCQAMLEYSGHLIWTADTDSSILPKKVATRHHFRLNIVIYDLHQCLRIETPQVFLNKRCIPYLSKSSFSISLIFRWNWQFFTHARQTYCSFSTISDVN